MPNGLKRPWGEVFKRLRGYANSCIYFFSLLSEGRLNILPLAYTVQALMCQFDSWTKIMYKPDGSPISVDWIRTDENYTYRHDMKPELHATLAISEEAKAVMLRHEVTKPLFLYIAMTAAHAPLQPMSKHEARCTHLRHPWRRGFCGMLVGADEAVGNISATAIQRLGKNTLFVVTSDNGGAPWFGGSNWPLRGGKTSPFEGGVRVPAFIVDFTDDSFAPPGGTSSGSGGRYLGTGDRWFAGLAHISDWLPTFLGWAGGGGARGGFDGFDLGPALRLSGENKSYGLGPRQEVLLDLYCAGEAIWDEEAVVALRVGKYKLIHGSARDPHWYGGEEADSSAPLVGLQTTDKSWFSLGAEIAVRTLEPLMGIAQFDTLRAVIVWNQAQGRFLTRNGLGALTTETFLFDIEADPDERHNLALAEPAMVSALLRRAWEIRDRRPLQMRYWMIVDNFRSTLVPGNCSGAVSASDCLFAHPWIPDDADLDLFPLYHSVDVATRLIHGKLRSMVRRSLFGSAAAFMAPSFWRWIWQ